MKETLLCFKQQKFNLEVVDSFQFLQIETSGTFREWKVGIMIRKTKQNKTKLAITDTKQVPFIDF